MVSSNGKDVDLLIAADDQASAVFDKLSKQVTSRLDQINSRARDAGRGLNDAKGVFNTLTGGAKKASDDAESLSEQFDKIAEMLDKLKSGEKFHGPESGLKGLTAYAEFAGSAILGVLKYLKELKDFAVEYGPGGSLLGLAGAIAGGAGLAAGNFIARKAQGLGKEYTGAAQSQHDAVMDYLADLFDSGKGNREAAQNKSRAESGAQDEFRKGLKDEQLFAQGIHPDQIAARKKAEADRATASVKASDYISDAEAKVRDFGKSPRQIAEEAERRRLGDINEKTPGLVRPEDAQRRVNAAGVAAEQLDNKKKTYDLESEMFDADKKHNDMLSSRFDAVQKWAEKSKTAAQKLDDSLADMLADLNEGFLTEDQVARAFANEAADLGHKKKKEQRETDHTGDTYFESRTATRAPGGRMGGADNAEAIAREQLEVQKQARDQAIFQANAAQEAARSLARLESSLSAMGLQFELIN